MQLTEEQEQQILAIVPKFTGGLGFICGSLLCYLIIQLHMQGKGNPMLRALFGVSFFETLNAQAWFLSTWAAPKWSGFAYASGNVASCEFQGFWLQFVIGAPMCNCALAHYFYKIAVHDKSVRDIAKLERVEFTAIIAYAVITSFLLLALKQYNHIGSVCWVIGSPPDCGHSSYHPNLDVPCERGDYAWLYGMILFYIPLWICILLILYFNLAIYRSLLISTDSNSDEARWFRLQSLLYAVAFCVTWAPSTTWSGMHWNGGGGFPLDLASALCEPLAAFWNLLIFLRNRPKLRKQLYNSIFCISNEDKSSSWRSSLPSTRFPPPSSHVPTSEVPVPDAVTCSSYKRPKLTASLSARTLGTAPLDTSNGTFEPPLLTSSEEFEPPLPTNSEEFESPLPTHSEEFEPPLPTNSEEFKLPELPEETIPDALVEEQSQNENQGSKDCTNTNISMYSSTDINNMHPLAVKILKMRDQRIQEYCKNMIIEEDEK